MPGAYQVVYKYNLQSSKQLREEGILVLISYRMKLRLRKGKKVAWRHPAELRGRATQREPQPTSSPFIQVATGGGSPVMATSSLSLFPATTTMEFSEVFPEQSRWIFGGSGGAEETLGTLDRWLDLPACQRSPWAAGFPEWRRRGASPASVPSPPEQVRGSPCLGTYSTLISGRAERWGLGQSTLTPPHSPEAEVNTRQLPWERGPGVQPPIAPCWVDAAPPITSSDSP